MINYATGRKCRRQLLLSYFGQKYTGENPRCCDVCSLDPLADIDMTIPSQKLMSCIIRTNSRFGASYVIDVLLGSRAKRILENSHNMISTWGIGRELNKDQWHELVELLVEKNYLLKFGDYNVLMLTNDGLSALKNRDKIMLPFTLGKNSQEFSGDSLRSEGYFSPKNRASAGANGGLMFPKPEKSSKSGGKSFVLHKKNEVTFDDDQEGARIQKEIKRWRKNLAQEMDVPPYVIFGDRTMNDIALKKPSSEDQLFNVNGLGERKIEKFGQAILKIVAGQ